MMSSNILESLTGSGLMENISIRQYKAQKPMQKKSVIFLFSKTPLFLSTNKIKKTEFKSENIKNYLKIEYRLIINTIKFLKR